MDVRLSPEQVALRDSAAQVVDRLGPATVAQLDDAERAGKLDAAVAAAGWRELRTATDDGKPVGLGGRGRGDRRRARSRPRRHRISRSDAGRGPPTPSRGATGVRRTKPSRSGGISLDWPRRTTMHDATAVDAHGASVGPAPGRR